MFTGIVQGMGEVVAVSARPDRHILSVRLPQEAAGGVALGASIANNGCCLTVTAIDAATVQFDVMLETLAKTNLGTLKAGDAVNIERALRFGDEIGGHVMSGHIMTTTQITRIETHESTRSLWFALPEALAPYVLPKGFIGLDGCSLTIGDVNAGEFNVHLIPETLARTRFGTRKVGEAVNVEIDAQTQAVVDTVRRYLSTHPLSGT